MSLYLECACHFTMTCFIYLKKQQHFNLQNSSHSHSAKQWGLWAMWAVSHQLLDWEFRHSWTFQFHQPLKGNQSFVPPMQCCVSTWQAQNRWDFDYSFSTSVSLFATYFIRRTEEIQGSLKSITLNKWIKSVLCELPLKVLCWLDDLSIVFSQGLMKQIACEEWWIPSLEKKKVILFAFTQADMNTRRPHRPANASPWLYYKVDVYSRPHSEALVRCYDSVECYKFPSSHRFHHKINR